jgi:hypothetical protein
MVDTTIDTLRKDAFQRRVKGTAGGNRILWSAKDIAVHLDYAMAMQPDQIIRAAAAPTALPKLLDQDAAAVRRKFAEVGIAVKADMQSSDFNILARITSDRFDLSNDSVKQDRIDCSDFNNRNPVVLPSHNAGALPIATSTAPWLSGSSTLAIAKFPLPGVNADSDKFRAAILAGLVRGVSIGFVPLEWRFSKDSTRPFGVDFLSIKLLEWSFVSIPCCPDCLVIGAVSGGKSADDVRMADLRREARKLAASAREISESIQSDPVLTREQRLAEARNFRHMAGRS